jgi:hypothetical protein
MPLLRGGTPSCMRQPTSSRINDFSVSFPSPSGGAPRIDFGPYASSSVFRLASLRSFPRGYRDAPLCILAFLDRLSLCSFSAGGSLIKLCPYGLYCGSHFMLDSLLQLITEYTDCGSHFCLTTFNFFLHFF